MIRTSYLVLFIVLIAIGSDNIFADSHGCQPKIICVNSNDFLKYEITGGAEILYEFGESLEDEKIQYTVKGTYDDGTPYNDQFILDKKTGDIFEYDNIEEKYSSLTVLIPVPIEPVDPDYCKNESFIFKDQKIDVLSCLGDEDESDSKLTFDSKTGILMESIIKINFDFLGDTKSLETYSRLIDTNIILSQDIDYEPEETQIDPPSLELDQIMAEFQTSDGAVNNAMTIDLILTDLDGNDIEHITYNIKATQGSDVLLNEEGHMHKGILSNTHITDALPFDASDSMPVVITIESVGFGHDEQYVPVTGEIAKKHVVPEFGAIAALILAVAIISIIVVSAKSRLSIMPRY